MGSIRTLLAISVLVTHADPIFGLTLLNGDMAITCFFMISGFLMALILTEKYGDVRRFYLNRVLRIYPPYYAALLVALLVFALIDSSRHGPLSFTAELWRQDGLFGTALGLVANLTLIGIDVTRYVSFDDGLVQFPAFLYAEGAGGHNLLLVPQAWTLAVELQFYLLAPLILRLSTLRIAALALLIFALRHLAADWANVADVEFDASAFLPLSLYFFLLGILGYRLYRPYRELPMQPAVRQGLAAAGVAAALVLIVTGRSLVFDHDVPRAAFYLAFALLLPLLFDFGRGRRWDAWAGEFSYPVYLFHFTAAQALYWLGLAEGWVGEATLLSTLLVSAAYIYALDRPLQRLRARIAAGRDARPERRVVEVPAR